MTPGEFKASFIKAPKDVADIIGQGSLFVSRRLQAEHPDHIPNIKIGRKRFVRIEDPQGWLDKHKVKCSVGCGGVSDNDRQ